MRVLLPCLLVGVCAVSMPLQAQKGEALEGWQKKVLEAIEESEQGASGRNNRRAYSRDRQSDRGAARAAEKARKRYGGEVLAVVKAGKVYRVRLLRKDGRVVTVTIEE